MNKLLTIMVCVIALGCVKSKDTSRITVRNKLRFTQDDILFSEPLTNLCLCVNAGPRITVISPRQVNIRRGSITFHGAGGYIRLTDNDISVIKSKSLADEVKIKMYKGTQNIQFHLTEKSFNMSINWSTEPSLTEYCDSNRCSYIDFCPGLIVVTNGNSFNVDIPVTTTDDFEGDITDWVILSNWK
jgi:hypothetical protein